MIHSDYWVIKENESRNSQAVSIFILHNQPFEPASRCHIPQPCKIPFAYAAVHISFLPREFVPVRIHNGFVASQARRVWDGDIGGKKFCVRKLFPDVDFENIMYIGWASWWYHVKSVLCLQLSTSPRLGVMSFGNLILETCSEIDTWVGLSKRYGDSKAYWQGAWVFRNNGTEFNLAECDGLSLQIYVKRFRSREMWGDRNYLHFTWISFFLPCHQTH